MLIKSVVLPKAMSRLKNKSQNMSYISPLVEELQHRPNAGL